MVVRWGMTVEVHNLTDYSVSTYMDVSREDALVSEWLLNNQRASQLHDEATRKQLKSRIKRSGPNGRTLVLDDFAISSIL